MVTFLTEKQFILATDIVKMFMSEQYNRMKIEDFKKVVCEKCKISMNELNELLEKCS